MAWVVACKAAAVDDGEGVVVDRSPEPPVGVFNIGGDFYAIDDTCTHDQYSLVDGYIEGDVVECPLHMAKFSICTGKVLSLPATIDLSTYPVKIADGVVLVDL
jgi:nitrite reductase/ring-hydroxylating ferredoxin subunit